MKTLAYIALILHLFQGVSGEENSCYDEKGNAQKCVPNFMNAAFNLTVDATNTCGLSGPQEFCKEEGRYSTGKTCGQFCDDRSASERHPPSFMTDFDTQYNRTWWQSESLFDRSSEWVGSRQQIVNLTLSLGKAFAVTYMRLRFRSPRPESFAIYKRTNKDSAWEAFQYYSATCTSTYGVRNRDYVSRNKQDVAMCTNAYTDISPLTGGTVVFSTLQGRPDAFDYENSEILQEWVTATDIRISLTRMNTFGDEAYGDSSVLKSYFYAIEDFAVGARCKCNGHASSCGIGPNGQHMCECSHNTTGPDCNLCKPLYNARPWARATELDANECLPCDCNGMSDECFFDEELYKQTGYGGHCTNCRDNRDGVNCEKCLPNYKLDPLTSTCTPSECAGTGRRDCPVVVNATVIGSETNGYTVTCIPGYMINADTEKFSCSESGEWEPVRPYCMEAGCKLSLEESRATVTDQDGVQLLSGATIDHGTEVTFNCPLGENFDVRTIACQFGTWNTETGQLPKCASCRLSPDGSIGSVVDPIGIELSSGAIIDHGATVTLKCPHGHYPDVMNITCQFGDWSTETGQFPQCEQVNCAPPWVNAVSFEPRKEMFAYKDTVVVKKCSGNLEFYGDQQLTCQKFGNWSSTAGCRKYCEGGKESFIDVQNQNIRVKANRFLKFSNLSLARCTQYCKQAKRFLCMAAVYGVDKRRNRRICKLFSQSPSQNPKISVRRKSWITSHRICKT